MGNSIDRKFSDWIRLRGVRVHNLRSVSADFPAGGITVLCGPSGSGKSSLALGALHAECRRRYLETLNPYLAQIAGGLSHVPMDAAEGLRPSVALEPGEFTPPPRSTVGSVCACDTLLRNIWHHYATLRCEQCGRALLVRDHPGMMAEITGFPENSRLRIAAPLQINSRTLGALSTDLLAQGFPRILADGREHLCAELDPESALRIPREAEVIVDRVILRPAMRSRIADSLDIALRISQGCVRIYSDHADPLFMSLQPRCPEHGVLLGNYQSHVFSTYSLAGRCSYCEGKGYDTSEIECPHCQGLGLRPMLLNSRWGALSWRDLLKRPIAEGMREFLNLAQNLPDVFQSSIQQLRDRLDALEMLGLSHLSLGRRASSLSDGELQRLRLVPLSSGHLSHLLFVLDEPCSGLHPLDIEKVFALLEKIRRRGNTLVLIEHQEIALQHADWVVEMGPGAAAEGGQVLRQGPPREVFSGESTTGTWLRAREKARPRPLMTPHYAQDVAIHFSTDFRYLKSLEIRIPTGALTVIRGTSGSGKSTLIFDVLQKLMHAHLTQTQIPPGLGTLHSAGNITRLIAADCRSMRTSRRSMIATITDILTPIRRLLAETPAAKMKGFGANRFSPNQSGGRCETCQGLGTLEDPTHYGETPCHVCLGRRFRDDILDIRFKTLNIAEILELSVRDALSFFQSFPEICEKLKPLQETGLDYLRLGQPTQHCSSGELQRLKLAVELREYAEPCLYLFDEPSRGLHYADICHLLDLFQKLLNQGHTLVVIEHQNEFGLAANQLLELGPGSGANGGQITFQEIRFIE